MKLIFRILKVIFPVIAYIMLITGCTSDGFILGGKYLDSNIRTAVIDTCSMSISTYKEDSVSTKSKEIGLIGKYEDPNNIWGNMEAKTYLTYLCPNKLDLTYDIIFDSLVLVMKLNGVFLGDTLKNQTIDVHRLKREVDADTSFYNTASIPYFPESIGTRTFRPRPNTTYKQYTYPFYEYVNRFTVRLDDSFGEELLDKITQNSEDLDNGTSFRDYFPGLAVTAGDDNSAIYGFNVQGYSSSSPGSNSADSLFSMRIYYHHTTFKKINGSVTINVDASRYFYSVEHNREGSLFDGLKGDPRDKKDSIEYLPTSATGNVGMIQALTSTYVKIEFPYLNELLQLGDFCSIVNATLLLYPVEGSFSDANPLPQSLVMYVYNKYDAPVGAVTTNSGQSLQTGSLKENEMYKDNTYYTYDVTDYLNDQLGAVGINKEVLKLTLPADSIYKSLNTLTFGDKNFQKDKTRLIIQYLMYENE